MSKLFKISFALVLVLSLIFTANPSDVTANGGSVNGISDGLWTAHIENFTEIPMNLVTTPGPEWSQLLTNAIVVPTPTKICHPMRGIRFGWVGEIRMLDGNKWIKVPAVVSNAEGLEGADPMVCANVAAGTFALWGYYDPAMVPVEDACAGLDFYPNGFYGEGTIDNRTAITIPPLEGVLAIQTFTNIVPAGAIWGDLTNFALTDEFGVAHFGGTVYYDPVNLESFTVRTSINGCTRDSDVLYFSGVPG